MFKLLVLAGSVQAFAAAPAMAGGHMKMEPPPPGDGPDGAVYRINLLSADEADASITVEFIHHPTF